MESAVVAHWEARAAELHFAQQGDVAVARFIGALVKLAAPATVLELGTGLGFTTSQLLANLRPDGRLDSVELDPALSAAAADALPDDPRLTLHTMPGESFLTRARPGSYDFIFADTWPGKYLLLPETLALVSVGGLYVVDDMNERSDWPADHAHKARSLVAHLTAMEGWSVLAVPFGTGLVVAHKQRP